MKKKKSLIYPTFFMLALSFILTFVLAYLNNLTTPIIRFNSEIELKQKILYVFEIKPQSNKAEDIDKAFTENVKESEFEGEKLFEYVKDGKSLGYAVPFSGPGLWGGINGYIGLSADLKTVLGVDFIKQDETPGLGGRIVEAFYKEQYRKLDVSNPKDGKLVINRPAPGGNIDAIAGATQTSTFVVKMINEDLMRFISTKGAN
ncbi:MAG: FMN-binding protein [Tissierellia bacterium]|nr:FMN-binding protein [Tissierellia bacterium]